MESLPGTKGDSAAWNSSRSRQRFAGSRSRPRSTALSNAAGRSRRSERIGGAGSQTIRASVAAGSPPWNGARPVSRQYSVAAVEYTSACGPTASPLICSGAANSGVPMNVPVRVSASEATSDLDRPKSPILTRPSASRKQLDGFTSRWTTPSRWASRSPSMTSEIFDMAFSMGIGPSRSTRSCRVVPGMSSMTM